MTNALFRNRARRSTEEGEVTNALFSQPRARIHRCGATNASFSRSRARIQGKGVEVWYDQCFVFAAARADPLRRGAANASLPRPRARIQVKGVDVWCDQCFDSLPRARIQPSANASFPAARADPAERCGGVVGVAAARADPTLPAVSPFRFARRSGISYNMFTESW